MVYMEIGLSVEAENKVGVLHKLTGIIYELGGNITYTQQFIKEDQNVGFIYMEIEGIKNLGLLNNKLKECKHVKRFEIHNSLKKIYGKRVIIVGGGAQVAEVARGAISEADRHNIRGERISVDTLPIVGEENLYEAVKAVATLPRVGILVLAGSLMGGKITEAVKELKEKSDIPVISLKMFGSVPKVVDLVVGDPLQAGVLAVMAIAKTAKFDIKKVKGRIL
ncbi:amino acid-binding ACT domain protein [Methanocaldococcus vulcanius M7]|uniref:Amino acid-binding ACT domain protein n=2 Tax=Methanocaldococcus TaxID=196118 RepID=C9RGL3_METVM|nr:amino acid-binding ACT domain protein [Methanocaldococcus vulcanius M7]